MRNARITLKKAHNTKKRVSPILPCVKMKLLNSVYSLVIQSLVYPFCYLSSVKVTLTFSLL